MKTTRLLLSAVLLAGFTLSQMPSVAECQVSMGNAVGCHMPCCKKVPMKNCPDLKPRPPHDVISLSSFTAELSPLKFIHTVVASRSPEKPADLVSFVAQETGPPLESLLFQPHFGRAPPSSLPA